MKKLVSALVLFGTLTSAAYAQVVTIQDPKNLLLDIDKFVDAQEFANAFKPFDSIVTETKECSVYNDGNGSYMECDGDEEEKWIAETGSDYALLNDNMAFLKSIYEKYDRNPVRFWFHMQKQNLLKSIQNYGLVKSNVSSGYIKLEALTPTTFVVQGASHQALRLDISFIIVSDDGSEYPLPMYVIVAKGLPFMGQIAEFGVEMEIDGHILPPTMKVIDAKKY